MGGGSGKGNAKSKAKRDRKTPGEVEREMTQVIQYLELSRRARRNALRIDFPHAFQELFVGASDMKKQRLLQLHRQAELHLEKRHLHREVREALGGVEATLAHSHTSRMLQHLAKSILHVLEP
eukprot:scaffold3144_cov260-Pinguiococcus_pyrenoidosus.AAC.7